jgi:hypothetical protein
MRAIISPGGTNLQTAAAAPFALTREAESSIINVTNLPVFCSRSVSRMKAEHRHQLHTNLLADRMGRFVQGMKASPRSTSPLIWVFAVLAVGTYVLWQVSMSSSQAEHAADWAKLDAALQLPLTSQEDAKKYDEDMRQIEKDEGSIPSRTARFQRARQLFLSGQADLTSTSVNRESAIARIKAARELYDQLGQECANSPQLAQETMLAYAKAEECLVSTSPDGDPRKELESAIQAYQRLATRFPESALGKEAAERAQSLQTKLDDVQKFYVELKDIAGPKPTPKAEVKPESIPEPKGP